jgi:hypothetical protein
LADCNRRCHFQPTAIEYAAGTSVNERFELADGHQTYKMDSSTETRQAMMFGDGPREHSPFYISPLLHQVIHGVAMRNPYTTCSRLRICRHGLYYLLTGRPEASSMNYMSAVEYISVGDYLQTAYRPDREYVVGEVRERNVGESAHAGIQAIRATWFGRHETARSAMVVTGQRMQVSAGRVRIPDVALIQPGPQPDVLIDPQLRFSLISRDIYCSERLLDTGATLVQTRFGQPRKGNFEFKLG